MCTHVLYDRFCTYKYIYILDIPGHTTYANPITAASDSVVTFDDHVNISTIAIKTWGR